MCFGEYAFGIRYDFSGLNRGKIYITLALLRGFVNDCHSRRLFCCSRVAFIHLAFVRMFQCLALSQLQEAVA